MAAAPVAAALESDTGATVASFNGPLDFSRLYRAEEYHQQYYAKGSTFAGVAPGASLPAYLGNQQPPRPKY